MISYLLRRLAASSATLLIILTASFFAVRLMPGSIYDDQNLPPDAAEAFMERAHLNEPIFSQYMYFLRGIFFEGDWGVSARVEPGMPAFSVIASRVPISLTLNAAALLTALPFGALAGAAAALRKGKASDAAVSVGAALLVSVPSFIIAALLQYVFAYRLGWFPILYKPAAPFLERVKSMILPVAALAFGPASSIARFTRNELAEALSADYMTLARVKGLNRLNAARRHAPRNIAVPLFAVITPMLAQILGGSMVVERLFSVPGVGAVLVKSISANDHSLTVAALIFYAAVSSITILAADILYSLIDPRITIKY